MCSKQTSFSASCYLLSLLLSVFVWILPVAAVEKQTYNVRDFGAAGNLKTLDTAAIQKAIDQCHSDGGGTVVFPSGYEFLSGTLVLKSHVTLEVQDGATLRGSRDLADYIKTVPEDIDSYAVINYSDYALIQSINAENVGIKGKGVIDGDGVAVPGRTGYGNLKTRPYILRFIRCKNVHIRNVMLKNSNFWTHSYLECDHLHIDGVIVRAMNLDPHQPNGDGVDIDGCQHVLIENMDIQCEDDGITLKSTTMRPMKDVLIRNNTVRSNVNAIKIGTETHGEIRGVVFRDNRVTFGGRSALTVQSSDGCHIENITFENIVIDKTAVPIFLRLGDRGRRIQAYDKPVAGTFDGQKRVRTPEDPEVGTMRNITFRNIIAKDVGVSLPPKKLSRFVGSAFSGVNGHKIENIVLENLELTYGGGILDRQKTYAKVPENPGMYPGSGMFGELPAYAFYFRHVDGLQMKNVYIRYLERDYRSAVVFDDAYNVEMAQVYVQRDEEAAPAVEFFRGSDGANVTSSFIDALDRYLIEGRIPAKRDSLIDK